MKVLSALAASLAVLSASAFAPVTPNTQRSAASSALSFSLRHDETVRKVVSSTLAAAFLAVNLATALPVLAMTPNEFVDFGSLEVLAGRSGGRSGGRASSGGNSRSYRAPARSSSNTYKSYSSTTVVRPSPTVIVSPGYGGGYGGYNPLGNMVTGYAMGSILGGGGNNYNNEVRDMRQENEIQQSRMELEQARLKVGLLCFVSFR
jgi:uncharacterized membrane protein